MLVAIPVRWPGFLSSTRKEFRAKRSSKQAFNGGQSERALRLGGRGHRPRGGSCPVGQACLLLAWPWLWVIISVVCV